MPQNGERENDIPDKCKRFRRSQHVAPKITDLYRRARSTIESTSPRDQPKKAGLLRRSASWIGKREGEGISMRMVVICKDSFLLLYILYTYGRHMHERHDIWLTYSVFAAGRTAEVKW